MVPCGVRFCSTRWLPRWRTMKKPFASSMADTSSPDRIRSLPNRDLDLRNENIGVHAPVNLRLIGDFKKQR